MVLSNKKLKQQMRAAKAQLLIEAQNGLASKDPKTVESLKYLQALEAQKSRLSKRQKQRQKSNLDNPNLVSQREVDGNVEATNVSKAKSEQVNAKKAKRKRDLPTASGSGNMQEPEASKKRLKKTGETGNKAGNKQINDETCNGIGTSDPEELVLNSFLGDDRKEQEPSAKVYVGGIPYYSTEDDIRSYFESCGSITHVDCLKFPDSGKFRGIAIITFKTEAAAKRALAFDGSDMGGLFLKIQPFKSAKGNKEIFSPAAVPGYYRIYVGNLAWNVTEDDLRKAFSDCKITSIRLGQDKETGEFKGYAHIDFANDLYFSMALKLDETLVCGRPIKISCAVPKKGSSSKPKVKQTDGNIDINARQDQTNNRNTEVALQQKDNYSNGNKGGGAHRGHLMDKDKISTVAKDQEISMEAGNVSSSKIRRRTCYECGEKGHLSTACSNKQAADIKNVATTDQEISMEARSVSSSKIRRPTCYECGEKDHLSSSCPNKQPADFKSVATTDQEISMEARSVSSSKIRRRTCYECGEKGHLSTACPNKQAADIKSVATTDQEISMEARSVSSSMIRRRTCYECGEKGHLSTACPNKQAADIKSMPST